MKKKNTKAKGKRKLSRKAAFSLFLCHWSMYSSLLIKINRKNERENEWPIFIHNSQRRKWIFQFFVKTLHLNANWKLKQNTNFPILDWHFLFRYLVVYRIIINPKLINKTVSLWIQVNWKWRSVALPLKRNLTVTKEFKCFFFLFVSLSHFVRFIIFILKLLSEVFHNINRLKTTNMDAREMKYKKKIRMCLNHVQVQYLFEWR